MQIPSPDNQVLRGSWIGKSWFVAAAFASIGLLTPNPLESLVAAALPVALLQILWRAGEPQVLLLATWFQALQVITPLLVANRDGVVMSAVMSSGAYSKAFFFSALSLVCLAIAARTGAGQTLKWAINRYTSMERQMISSKVFYGYLGALIVYLLTPLLAASSGGLAQLVLPLASIRLIFAFFIFNQSLRRGGLDAYAVVILLVETVLGFTGFFAGFKSVYIVAVLSALSSGSSPLALLRSRTIAVALVFIILASYWQAVKTEYRSYVNLGQRSQSVSIPIFERLAFHGRSIFEVNPESLVTGLTSGFDRLGYITFFAGSIQQVPDSIPHQNGRLWQEALEFASQPRIFFPDKPIADDSFRTNTFSGYRVSGAAEGTSISIGYVGESYIDFGFPIMLAPLAVMGWIWGRLYRLLLLVPPVTPLNFGAGVVLILNTATLYESSNLKLLPAVLLNFIVFWGLLNLFKRPATRLWHWLTTG